MTTLSLRTCQRLNELLPGIETEMRWFRSGHHWSGNVECEPGIPELTNEKPPYDFPYKVVCPAFSFSELIRLLPALGEKLGLETECRVDEEGNFLDAEFLNKVDRIVSKYMFAPTPEEGLRLVDEYVWNLIKP